MITVVSAEDVSDDDVDSVASSKSNEQVGEERGREIDYSLQNSFRHPVEFSLNLGEKDFTGDWWVSRT